MRAFLRSGRVDPATTVADRALSYPGAGSTQPDRAGWSVRPRGFRALQSTTYLGTGAVCWAAAAAAGGVLEWAVKTRSGFRVHGPDGPVEVAVAAW